MKLTTEFLSSWPRVWEMPDIWIALCAGEVPEPSSLTKALLHRMSSPTSAERVWRDLLARGELDAAGRLAERASFVEKLSEEALESFLEVLGKARREQERSVDMQGAEIVALARRLRADPGGVSQRLELAVELARGRLADAEKLLSAERAVLTALQGELENDLSAEAELRSEGAADTIDDETIADWKRAVDRALATGELDLTRWLIQQGPSARLGGSPLTIPARARWLYTEPPLRVCDWFLLDTARVPIEFPHRWAALEGDRAATDLIRALKAMLESQWALVPELITSFVLSLESFLDCPVHAAPIVLEGSGGAWRTSLRGLGSPELPALALSLYPAGIPLIIVPKWDQEVFGNVPAHGLSLVLSLEGHVSSVDGALELSPQRLFALARDRAHRRTNFLRGIGSQVPYAQAFPTSPPPSSEVVRGRDDTLAQIASARGVCFLVGPRGIGKTSLLLRLAEDARRNGDGVVLVDAAPPEIHGSAAGDTLARVREALRASHREGALPARQEVTPAWIDGLACASGRLVVLIDNAETVGGDHDAAAALATFVETLVTSSQGRIRCVVAGGPRLVLGAGIGNLVVSEHVTIVSLKGLGFAEARRLLVGLADFLDLRFSTTGVLDRITFYTGGHPALVHAMVSELLHRIGLKYARRREAITLDDVEAVWSGERFRVAARPLLLSWPASASLLDVALAFLVEQLEVERPSEWMQASYLVDWLRNNGVPVRSSEVEDALAELTYLGISESRTPEDYQLVRSGVGYLVASLLGDVQTYITRAIEALASVLEK